MVIDKRRDLLEIRVERFGIPPLEVLFDPSHPEHKSLSHWIPRGWGPELFKPEKVRFDHPLKRWEKAFTEIAHDPQQSENAR